MAVVCVSLVFLLLSFTFGKIKGCKDMDFQTLLHNRALVNHVIKTQKTSSDLECQSKCFLDDRCISYSFGTSASGETGMCELSDSDHLMHPEDLVDRPGVTYRSAQNSCECPVGGNFKCRFNFADRTHRCECKPGFTGSDCKITIDECASNPCQHGGTCRDQVNSYTCTCAVGFTGDNCQTDIDECASDPCRNGGTCQDQVNSHICTCAAGFTGFNCQAGGVRTQWTPWSTCYDHPNCSKIRTRYCTNPAAPQSIGTDCDGPAMDSNATGCQISRVNTKGCENALGMEDGSILDSQITGSSSYRHDHSPRNGRLNSQPGNDTVGIWAPVNDITGEYIQVDLGRVKKVTKIATQGRPTYNNQWVTEYSVSYSNDTSDWTNYHGNNCVKKFPGNSDGNTVVTNKIEIPIAARYIRVIVQKWHRYPVLRMELYGCTVR